MGNFYVRIGNRTLKNEEYFNLKAEDRQKYIAEGDRANQIRLENMRKGLGLEPAKQAVTLDVTPEGIAKRNAAIEAEEAKIAAETKVEVVDTPAAVEAPAEVTKKSKGKKSKTVATE